MKQTIFKIDLGTHSYVPPAKAVRTIPRHWHIYDPDAGWQTAREAAWLVVKTLVAAALVVVAYAAVAA